MPKVSSPDNSVRHGAQPCPIQCGEQITQDFRTLHSEITSGVNEAIVRVYWESYMELYSFSKYQYFRIVSKVTN